MDCPQTEIEQLRAENERLSQLSVEYTALINSVAEARDKTAGEAERNPDPDMRVIFAAISGAYESVISKSESIAFDPTLRQP